MAQFRARGCEMRHSFFVAALVVFATFVVGVPTADAQISSIFQCGDPTWRGTTAEDIGCRLEDSQARSRYRQYDYWYDPRYGYDRRQYDRYGRRSYDRRVPAALEVCQYEECYGIRGTFHGHQEDGRRELHFRPFDETDKPIGTREGGLWGGAAGAGAGAAVGGKEGAAVGAGIGAAIGGFLASRKTHDNCILIGHPTRGHLGHVSSTDRLVTYSMVNRTGARVDLYKAGVLVHRFESGEREDFPPSNEYKVLIRLTANDGRESTRPAEIRPTRDGKSWEIVPKED